MDKKSKPAEKIIATNRQASFRYEILEKFEAGIMLVGSEVKSLREGHANLGDSHIMHHHNELFVMSLHISHYAPANQFNHDPLRTRKLLLHEKEIMNIIGRIKERGLTVIPTKLYFKKGRVKCEIAIVRGKKNIDRREDLKKKTHQREIERALRRR